MIDQTVPLPDLAAGMARCVREWILPHLSDAMARTQAETLASLLDALPAAMSVDAHRAIAADSAAAREMLRALGEPVGGAAASDIDGAMRDNAALKARLQAIADDLRGDTSAERRRQLRDLQAFFVESMRREIEMATRGADFAAMTAQEGAARKS